MLVYDMGLSMDDEASIIWSRLFSSEYSNGQVFYDMSSNVWVLVLRCWSLWIVRVVIKCVSAMEEFAHISTNVMVYQKGAARMIIAILWNIKNVIVKDNKLATVFYFLFELYFSHGLALKSL